MDLDHFYTYGNTGGKTTAEVSFWDVKAASRPLMITKQESLRRYI